MALVVDSSGLEDEESAMGAGDGLVEIQPEELRFTCKLLHVLDWSILLVR